MHYAVRVFTYTYKTLSQAKRWARISFVSPQIANLQILGLIPQSQIRKFMRCASPQITNPQIVCLVYSPQIANPQICKDKSSVSYLDPHWFVFLYLPGT